MWLDLRSHLIETEQKMQGKEMIERDRVFRLIYGVIERLNEQRKPDERIKGDSDSVLMGSGGSLDSLGLVNLIVATEEAVEQEFGTPITLSENMEYGDERSPFHTISSLADHMMLLLGESRNDENEPSRFIDFRFHNKNSG